MIPGVASLYERYCSFHNSAESNAPNMTQNEQLSYSFKMTGFFMSISMILLALLFIYIVFSVIMNVAGIAIVILLFIAFAFSIVLMKSIKLMDKLALAQPSTIDVEYESRISTIEDLVVQQNRTRQDSLPPSYDEAMKSKPNSPSSTESANYSLPKYSSVIKSPHSVVQIEDTSSSGPHSV